MRQGGHLVQPGLRGFLSSTRTGLTRSALPLLRSVLCSDDSPRSDLRTVSPLPRIWFLVRALTICSDPCAALSTESTRLVRLFAFDSVASASASRRRSSNSAALLATRSVALCSRAPRLAHSTRARTAASRQRRIERTAFLRLVLRRACAVTLLRHQACCKAATRFL